MKTEQVSTHRCPPLCLQAKVTRNLRTAATLVAAVACLGSLGGAPAYAANPAPWYFTFYLQQSYPTQTNTNLQIQQINQMFGSEFEDWSDVANLSVGTQLFRRVSPYWKVGVQLDYSAGAIKGNATVATEAGPANLAFEQRYDTYFDVYAVAHFLPCPSCTKAVPFIYGGAGIGYEKDRTTLALTNDVLNEGLRVDNSGWFPTYSAGLGVDIPLSSNDRWYVELGGAYVWARMTKTQPATGSLAPAPEVTADTDFTGPNYWVGFGVKF